MLDVIVLSNLLIVLRATCPYDMVAHNAHGQRFVHEAWKTVNNYCAQLEIVASQPRIAALQARAADKPEAGRGGGCIAQVGQSGYLFVSKRMKVAADAFMAWHGGPHFTDVDSAPG